MGIYGLGLKWLGESLLLGAGKNNNKVCAYFRGRPMCAPTDLICFDFKGHFAEKNVKNIGLYLWLSLSAPA